MFTDPINSGRLQLPRERAERQPAEDEALVMPERGGCEERADPGAGAAHAETKQLQRSTRPERGMCVGKGHARIPNAVNGEWELVNGLPLRHHSLFAIHQPLFTAFKHLTHVDHPIRR